MMLLFGVVSVCAIVYFVGVDLINQPRHRSLSEKVVIINRLKIGRALAVDDAIHHDDLITITEMISLHFCVLPPYTDTHPSPQKKEKEKNGETKRKTFSEG